MRTVAFTPRSWILSLSLIFVLFLLANLPAMAQQERRTPQSRQQVQLSYAPLVKETAPAVVNVYASRDVVRRSTPPLFDDPFFRRFFDVPQQQRPQKARSLGSGVIVRSDGFIITNHHVVQDADEVRVALSDGREFPAEIILKDESTDLAVLKISTREPLPILPLGNSDDLEVGDIVLAIGNPFGVGQTVTSGIVSAVARTKVGISDYGFFIQTDAAINPGNSGGALVDMNGELIGINTAIFSRSGGSNGIGFAIPVNTVRTVIASAEGGRSDVARPWFGAELQTVDNNLALSLGLDRPKGALVTQVDAGSPADAAGLRQGDLILKLDGADVASPEAFFYMFATKGVSGDVVVDILRRGRPRQRVIALQEIPQDLMTQKSFTIPFGPLAGAIVEEVSRETARKYRLAAEKGVVVVGFEPRATAQSIGLVEGDVILSVNDVETTTMMAIEAATGQNSRSWKLVIQRGRSILRQFYRN